MIAKKEREDAWSFELGGERYLVHSYAVEDAIDGPLSASEREVVRLVLQGFSNAQIAQARGTSVHTIGNQVSSILRKLKLGSRYELIAKLAR